MLTAQVCDFTLILSSENLNSNEKSTFMIISEEWVNAAVIVFLTTMIETLL